MNINIGNEGKEINLIYIIYIFFVFGFCYLFFYAQPSRADSFLTCFVKRDSSGAAVAGRLRGVAVLVETCCTHRA